MTVPLIVLSWLQKKSLEDNIDTDKDDMSIAHDGDLQLIKDVVCVNQNAGLVQLRSVCNASA